MLIQWRRFDVCDVYTICEFCSSCFYIKEKTGDLTVGIMM